MIRRTNRIFTQPIVLFLVLKINMSLFLRACHAFDRRSNSDKDGVGILVILIAAVPISHELLGGRKIRMEYKGL